jgi:hypothetical protein
MTVDLDRPKGAQRRVFSFFPGLNKEAGEIDTDHGWAGTNYKAQCKTIDYVYPLHNPIASRNTSYVAMTRDKAEVFLAVARDETGGYRGLVEQMSHGKNKRAAHSYFMKDEQSTQPERIIQKQEEVMAKTEHQPRVKILGWEFGESGRKARGTEGLYKAAGQEDEDLVVQRHNGVTVYPQFDGKTVIPKWDQQEPKRSDVGQSAYGKNLKEGEAKGWPRGVSKWAESPTEPKKREEKPEQPKRGWSVNDIPGSSIVKGAARKIESVVDNLEEKMREKWNHHVADPVRCKTDKVLNPVRNLLKQSEQQKERDAKREEKKTATQGPETGNGRTRDMTSATKPQSKTVRDDVDRAFRPALPAQSKQDKTPTVAPGQSDGKGQESRPAPAKHNLPRDQGHSGGSGLGM